jgi:hypothetical protein
MWHTRHITKIVDALNFGDDLCDLVEGFSA